MTRPDKPTVELRDERQAPQAATVGEINWAEMEEPLRAGDEEAIDFVTGRLWQRLMIVAVQRLEDPLQADDVVEAALRSAFAKIRRPTDKKAAAKPIYDWEGFFFAHLAFKVKDQNKRTRRHWQPGREGCSPVSLDQSNLDAGEGGSWAGSVPDPNALPPDEIVMWQELLMRLRIARASLPIALQEVIYLRIEEECGLEQMAELLNTPLGTIYGRYRSALDRLREQLS